MLSGILHVLPYSGLLRLQYDHFNQQYNHKDTSSLCESSPMLYSERAEDSCVNFIGSAIISRLIVPSNTVCSFRSTAELQFRQSLPVITMTVTARCRYSASLFSFESNQSEKVVYLVYRYIVLIVVRHCKLLSHFTLYIAAARTHNT